MLGLSTIQNALLAYTAAALVGKHAETEELDCWEKILQECRHQSVALLVFPVIKNKISSELHSKWVQQSHNLLATNLRSELSHCELHRIMAAAGVPYVIMKGCASAAYYPDPLLRTMGDVDFLVAKCDLERAEKALEAAGYSRETGHDDRVHYSYHKGEGIGKTILEMHWEPNGIPEGDTGAIIREYLSSCISEAIPYKTASGIFMGPPVFHHGLIILLHTATHLINSGIGLRHLCDWAVFVGSLSEEEFCETFEQKLKKVGLWRFAQILTQLSIVYLGCTEKKWAGEKDEELLESLMLDIFAGGNFGRKDSQRINQAKFMANRRKGNVDNTSALKQFCKTMNDKVRLVMPMSKRLPVLIPIGWIYVGIRHLFRIFIGKRPKVNMGRVISGVKERKEIYQKLALFEIE